MCDIKFPDAKSIAIRKAVKKFSESTTPFYGAPMQFTKLNSLAEVDQYAAGCTRSYASTLHTVDALRLAWEQAKVIIGNVQDFISESVSSVMAALALDWAEITAFDAALTAGATPDICAQWHKIAGFVKFVANWFGANVAAVLNVLIGLADTLCPVA